MRAPFPQDIREDIRFGPLTLTAALWVFVALVLGAGLFVFYPFGTGENLRTRLIVSFLPAAILAVALILDAPLWWRRAEGYLRRLKSGDGIAMGVTVPGEVYGELAPGNRAVLVQILPPSWEIRPEAERASSISAWRSALRLAAAEDAAVTVFAETVPDLNEEAWSRQEALANALGGPLGAVAAARVRHHRRLGESGAALRVVYTLRLSGIGKAQNPMEVAATVLPELEGVGETCLVGADLAGFVAPINPSAGDNAAVPDLTRESVKAAKIVRDGATSAVKALSNMRLFDAGAMLAERRKTKEWKKVAQGPPKGPAGIVVAVLGASGGVGRTTVAANLAVAWAGMGRRVSALDLCHGAPALADYLGLRSYAPGRWEALARGEAPAVVLVPGGAEGVRVLPGPTLAERETLVGVQTDAVARLIQQLRTDDDYIVLDTPADPLDAFTQLALSQAAVAVFVSDASPGAVRRLGQALNGPWRGGGVRVRALVVTRVRLDFGRDAKAVSHELAVYPNLAVPDAPQTYWPSVAGQPVAASDTEEGRVWRNFAEAIDKAMAGAAARAVVR